MRVTDRRPCLLGLLALLATACAGPAATSAPPPAPSAAAAPAQVATAPAAVPAPAHLKVVYTAVSGSTWPLWLAQDAGLLAQNGIDAELEYVVSSTTAIQSLLSGEVAFI